MLPPIPNLSKKNFDAKTHAASQFIGQVGAKKTEYLILLAMMAKNSRLSPSKISRHPMMSNRLLKQDRNYGERKIKIDKVPTHANARTFVAGKT